LIKDLRYWLLRKINEARCNLISSKQYWQRPPLKVGYLTIFHDYEAQYAVADSAEASYNGITSILDIERKHKVKATYNIVARLIDDFPEIVSRIISDGHELASHSYDHRIMANLSKEEIRYDILKTKTLFDSIGAKLSGFRSPQCAWTFGQMKVLVEQGLSWSAEPDQAKYPYVLLQNRHNQLVRMPTAMDDWQYKSEDIHPEKMLKNLLAKVENIARLRTYCGIGFHPWIQGEDDHRLEVFENFIDAISARKDLRIVTFGEMHDVVMKLWTKRFIDKMEIQ